MVEKKSQNSLTYRQMRISIETFIEIEKNLKEKISHIFIKPIIREATDKDVETIANIYNKSWLTSNTPFSRISSDDWMKIYNDPKTILLIIKLYGIDAGFILLDFEGQDNQYGVIVGLGILPRFQNKGLGKILGLAAWERFKQHGVKEVRTEVYIDNNRSYAFTKSLGFQQYKSKVYDDLGHSYKQNKEVKII